MHDTGIQCCFDPICCKIVETQTDEQDNASTNVSEKTSNKFSLLGQDGAHVPVEVDKSTVKHNHSYATQPPPYVIFMQARHATRMCFPKAHKRWVVKSISEKKSYHHLSGMISEVIKWV